MEFDQTIGIDIDDVLIDFTKRFYEYHNRTYGTRVRFEDIHTFGIGRVLGIGEQSVDRIHEFYASEDFVNLPPVEGAVEAVILLSQSRRLIAVTSRPKSIEPQTVASLDKYFPGIFQDVVLLDSLNLQYSGGSVEGIKLMVCQKLGIEILIDDHEENLRGAGRFDIRAFLFRRPWNKCFSDEDLKKEGIIPVETWPEVIKIF